MEKTYSPKDIENACYEEWEKEDYFKPAVKGDPFCIMLPPPNVTGSLHMGHGFQHTLMDAIIRYQRMMGKRTLWQPGTDHAGISTQLVVERLLAKDGITKRDLSREEFLKQIWSWKETYKNRITSQMKRLGDSCDWSRERFTMDDGLSKAVLKVFVELYEEGLIYRGTRLVNWDTKLGTAISDLEVISEEEDGFLWYISYPVLNSKEKITIATTRPETMLGDTAVAVNPEDSRYKHLIGKEIALPLSERNIPIIADEYVDKEFGTGCVKITPAHDFNDHEVGKRHNLPIINILTKKGKINKNAPVKYQGMPIIKAREEIIRDLKAASLLVKTEPHKLKVPRGEKSNTIIEPLLTDQWYVKTDALAKDAIDVVKSGQIKFTPENWTKTYFHWMENIEDWCISRQLVWGHRIPAWYDNQGKIYVGLSENDVRFKYKLNDDVVLKQDEDVLDTWFSSALWPFSTLGWPLQTKELEEFFPTSVLVTGFDIIFFWVARMIMMALKFTGKVPFKEVVITGLICDHEGKKMSKSKGNVLDPLDIIDGIELESLVKKRTANLLLDSVREDITKATKKQYPDGIATYGTDALRFTYCAIASNARTLRFDLNRVEGYRNFCNKLWNASRFVLLNTEDERGDFGDNAFQYSPQDKWILTCLQRVKAKCHEYFASYRFDLLAGTLYDFVWHEYCDWYLELSKPILYNDEVIAPIKRGARRTLIHVLDQILKLMHPIMPFITETIWQRVSKLTSTSDDSIVTSSYPIVEEALIIEGIEVEFGWLKEVIQAIRTIRSEMNIAPSKEIPLLLKTSDENAINLIKKYEPTIKALAKIANIRVLNIKEKPPISATAVIEKVELLIPMAELIDVKAEHERLNKEIDKLNKDIEIANKKLTNPNFVKKAPEEIIQKEKAKLINAKTAKQKLVSNLEKLKNIK